MHDARARVSHGGGRIGIAVVLAALVALVVAAFVTGCAAARNPSASGSPAGSTSSSAVPASEAGTPGTDTPVTDMGRDLEISWSLAAGLSAADTATISDALRNRGVHMLFPTAPPGFVPASASGEFTLWVTVPTRVVTPGLATYAKDWTVLLSLVSSLGPVEARTGWQSVQVRGHPGRAYQPSGAVAMLEWTEDGQFFHAELGALSMEQAIEWLGSWRMLP
jgi:hypothetical protein